MGLMKWIRSKLDDDGAKAKKVDDRPPALDLAAGNYAEQLDLRARSKQGELLSEGAVDGRERFGHDPLRDADDIAASGVLEAFATIDVSDAKDKDEFFRTLEDDANLVKADLAEMSPEQIGELKKQLMDASKGSDDEKTAIAEGYYGSDLHKQYGATIELLTGGVISAEEAMVMNPSGGRAGPGSSSIGWDEGVMARHAIRHDAAGFLGQKMGVGPGYGTKSSFLGLDSDNPLAGQFAGIAREMRNPSELPAIDHVMKR